MPLLKKEDLLMITADMETIRRTRARITQESRCRCFCIRHPIREAGGSRHRIHLR